MLLTSGILLSSLRMVSKIEDKVTSGSVRLLLEDCFGF